MTARAQVDGVVPLAHAKMGFRVDQAGGRMSPHERSGSVAEPVATG